MQYFGIKVVILFNTDIFNISGNKRLKSVRTRLDRLKILEQYGKTIN